LETENSLRKKEHTRAKDVLPNVRNVHLLTQSEVSVTIHCQSAWISSFSFLSLVTLTF